ncbi:RNA polymerase I [Suillus subalutaceus]|uniref:RNA polymerase I n=1 Tax=Suillus subalutaceus TaxID=48586 RepID=UPI001B884C77|nr:RNA polymerase I [Suillus subalutaceus]KAG1867894.1 RNA polymerase I [Suillus subalutaceus]
MASTSSSIVFDDIFTTDAIDKDGKNSIEVRVYSCATLFTLSRLYAHSKNYGMDLTLDYNIELFPLVNGDSFAMALASSLSRDGGAPTADGEDKDRDVWRPDGKGRRGLEEDYDYVMYEKVYKFDTGSSDIAYASFGGLLLSITGSYRHLTNVVLGDPVYVLLRK